MDTTAHTPTITHPNDPHGDERAPATAGPERATLATALADDRGATTAEYAITTLAACGFAALLVVVLKSDPIREAITGVISTALGMGA